MQYITMRSALAGLLLSLYGQALNRVCVSFLLGVRIVEFSLV